jgi:hypothetical protein
LIGLADLELLSTAFSFINLSFAFCEVAFTVECVFPMTEQQRAKSPQFDDVRVSTAAHAVDQAAREKSGLAGAQLAKTMSQRIQVGYFMVLSCARHVVHSCQ